MLMKNLKTQVFTILFICLCLVSCKAQQVLPLNAPITTAPNNSYFKDMNNELDPYVGSWQANFQNKTIKLVISKQFQAPLNILFGKTFYQDALLARYEVSTNGTIQQSSLTKDFAISIKYKIESTGTEDNGNTVNLVFSGGNCSIGLGNITFQKIDNTHFNWSYFPKTVGMNDIDCPPNQDYNIYLPITQNLIFTKQ